MNNNYHSSVQKEYTSQSPGIADRSLASTKYLALAVTFFFFLLMAFQVKGQSITLLSPNGGETWMNGTTQTISWEWDGDSAPVYVYYSYDGGVVWDFIGNADENETALDIQTDLFPGELTKIKVTAADDAGINDESDDYFTVVSNPVYFITPQGGEQFYANQEVTLYWDSFQFFDCDVDFSSDGGQNWTNLETDYFLNFLDWTVPELNSDQCILRVSDASDPSVFGLSANFSILEQPTATFTSPVGGDIWTYGEEVTMSWTGANLPLQVYFDYSLDGGQSWNYLGNANSESTFGSVELTVPKVSSTNAKIRMVTADYSLVIGITEEPFTFYLPPVIILDPYEGQEYYINGSATVWWYANEVELVNIELSRDGGENWEIIESNLDADQVFYTWDVIGSPSDNCRIKVSDINDPTKFDISGQFTLLATPVISLINPVGNDLLKTETTYAVSWSYENPEFYYLVAEYSIDSGASWTNIGFGLPANGSVDWKTPAIGSDQCFVRIYDSNLPFVADTSEVFEIRDYPDTPICIVSVDSTTNQNVIIWEKPETDQIRDYIVYKETDQMDIFQPIGTVAYDSLPMFVDVNSNPTIRSYRYKLGFDDSEGYVYPMGDLHQTIHLTISKGIGNSWNLNWGNYLGFDVPSYNIYRSANGADYQLIETISSSFLSFTDLEAPDGEVYYFIEVVNENGCTLTSREITVSNAISNIVTNNFLSVENPGIQPISNVYPNPASQWLNIVTGPEDGLLEITLFDMSGRTILNENFGQVNANYQTKLNVSTVEDGIYFLKVALDKKSQIQKVAVRR